MRALLQRDPSKRLGSRRGANDIKAHPFLRGIDWPLIRHVVFQSSLPLNSLFLLVLYWRWSVSHQFTISDAVSETSQWRQAVFPTIWLGCISMGVWQVPPPLDAPLDLTTTQVEADDKGVEVLEWEESEATWDITSDAFYCCKFIFSQKTIPISFHNFLTMVAIVTFAASFLGTWSLQRINLALSKQLLKLSRCKSKNVVTWWNRHQEDHFHQADRNSANQVP